MTLDEAIEQLSEEELDLLNSDPELLKEFQSKYAEEPSLGDKAWDMTKSAGKKVWDTSKHLGKMVEAGGSGIAEIDSAIAPKLINSFPPVAIAQALGAPKMEEKPILPAVVQAGKNVEDVMADRPVDTSAGRAGKFVGSFFTPNQIALQYTGAKAAGPIMKGLGYVAKPVAKFAVNAFPKVSEMLGVAPKAASTFIDNPAAVSAAKELPQMADEVASTVKGLSQTGMKAAEAGKALLSDTKMVTGIEKQLMKYADEIGGGPGAEEAEQAAAKYVREFVEKVKGKLSEKEVGQLIESLDKKLGGKWAKANPTAITEAKEGVRRILSNALQSSNKQYAAKMAESSATFDPADALERTFGLKEGLPSNSTAGAMNQVLNPNAFGTQRALEAFPALSGQMANAAAKAAIQESLLGKSLMFGVPKLAPTVSGAVQSLPALGNAIYQGLRG